MLLRDREVKAMLKILHEDPIDVSIEKYKRIKKYIESKDVLSDEEWDKILDNVESADTCGLCVYNGRVCGTCVITKALDEVSKWVVKHNICCGCEFTPWNKLIEELSEGEQDWKEILYLVNKEIKFLEGLKNEKHN